MQSKRHRGWSWKLPIRGKNSHRQHSNSGKSLPRPIRLEILEDRTLLSAAALGAAYGLVPLSFEPNLGQTNSQFNFVSHGSGYTLLLNSQEAILALQPGQSDTSSGSQVNSQTPSVLQMQLVGANPAAGATGLDRQPGVSNYFLGNDPGQWHANVPNFAQTQYQGVYPGVDLVYYGNQTQLEYDFRVAPGADPSDIQLRFAGAQGIALDSAGNLVIHTPGGDVVEHAPVLYQQDNGVRQAVAGHYVLEANGQVGFQVGPYDTTQELVIDPVLSYSTYLGGSGEDSGNNIAVDSVGNAYISGYTQSTDFPIVNGLQTSLGSATEVAYIAKLNAAGTALMYSTYLGGNGTSVGFGIAIDDSGNAYLTGQTTSTDFPTLNPIQSSLAGKTDGFVIKLNATGSALVYSTYLGGSNIDQSLGIALDHSGNVYVVGTTGSVDFPLANALDSNNVKNTSAFVSEINAAGTALVFSTYLGGSTGNGGFGIAVDSAGAVYVVGETSSADFPVTADAIQPNFGGVAKTTSDAYLTKLSPGGASIVYSTYLGGSDNDQASGIALDSDGNIYLSGDTYSTNFPTANALQPNLIGGQAAFITKLNAAGTTMVYSTYLGGDKFTFGGRVAVDSVGDAFVVGWTSSTNFPTLDALQSSNAGNTTNFSYDAFISEFSPTGTLAFSTYLGGSNDDGAAKVALDSFGNIFVVGTTSSSDFPTVHAVQATSPGGQSGFVLKIVVDNGDHIPVVTAPSSQSAGQNIAATINLGSFSETGVSGTWNVDVNWGDGTQDATFSVSTQGSLGTLTHTFAAAGADTVTVTVTDRFGNSGSSTFTVPVFAPPVLTPPANQEAGQGVSATIVLGSFSQPGLTGSWNVKINWGDGSADTTFSANSQGSLGTRTHAYSAAGADTVTVTVTDPFGNTDSDTFTVTVSGPPVLTPPSDQAATQGISATLTLGSFSQPGVTGSWNVDVNWGDGTSDTTFSVGVPGSLGTQAHAFGNAGADTVTVTITDPFGNTGSDTFTVNVSAAPVVTPPLNQTAGQGIAASINLGSFSETGVSGAWNVDMNWGDGTPDATFSVSAQGSLGALSHTFAAAGSDTMTVTVTDALGNPGSATFHVSVFGPPVLIAPSNQSVGEGISAAIALGSFSQPGATGSWNVDVNWGDGSADTTFSASAPGSLGTQPHAFNAAGADTVTVTLTDPFGNTASNTFTVTVFAPPALTPPSNQATGQGISAALTLGSFSQPGVTGSWNVDVNWGDGTADTTFSTSSPGSLGTQTHAFGAAGVDTVTVTLTDPFGNTGSDMFTVTVFAPPVLTPPSNQTAGRGITAAIGLGSFSQPGVTGTWNIEVNWGDGTADTTFSTSSPGSLGTQTHAFGALGADTVTITVIDPFGNSGTATFQVAVSIPPVLTRPSNQAAGQGASTAFALGSFSQPGAAGPWKIEVNWGDGTPDTTFRASAQGSLGTQSHTYSAAGADTVTVTLTDPFGNSDSDSFTVTVYAPPVLTPPSNQTAARGIASAFTLGSFSQPGDNGPWNVVLNWGDGSANTTFSTSAQGSLGTRTHAFSTAGVDTVTITVTDPSGNSGTTTFNVSAFAPPVLTPPSNQAAGKGNAASISLGSFSQAGVTGSWNVDVNWGDGTAHATFSAGAPGSLGTRTHSYSATGTETVTVTLIDPFGNTGSDTFTVTVFAPPVLTPPSNQAAGQGIAAALSLGSFSQSGVTGTWNVKVNWGDGAADTTFSASAPGSLGTQTHAFSAVGTDTVTVTVTDPFGNSASDTFTVSVNAPPVLTPPSDQTAGKGIAAIALGSFNQPGVSGTWNVDVNWGDGAADTTFSASAPGSLGTQTHAFSAAGTDTVTVTVTDPFGNTDSDTFTVSVNAPVTIGPRSLPGDTINVAYNHSITASGGIGNIRLVVSNVQNPIAGLNIPDSSANALAITGTPTATGTETFTVTATDQAGGTVQADFRITVNPGVTLSPSFLSAGTINAAYNQTITASGGTGNISLAVSNVQNPIAGLSVPDSGARAIAITGTPTATGTETFTVTATDEAGGVTQTSFSITSLPAGSTVKISGAVFFDHDSSGTLNTGDTGLAGRTVFLDLNNSGQIQPGDPSTVTAADGSFQFTSLAPGAYTVSELLSSDNVALTGPASQVVNATADVTGINFGNVIFNPAFPVHPTADLHGSNPDPATAYMTGLYQAILGRNPDSDGLTFWVSALHAGMSEAEAASLFVNSREHCQNEVDYYYKTFLGRAADPASAVWVNELTNGGSEGMVIQGILTSPEYAAKHASNAAFVSELYFQLLGRQADKTGAAFWEQELASGISRADVVGGLLYSRESADLATASFYSAFLQRAGDQTGKDYWAKQLTSQSQTFGQVAVDFFSTPPQEFMNKG